nr:reverse transcriptase domain-containing protein [Tanacetum cinerariifolium]
TDIANITRKWPKPDKNEHKNGNSTTTNIRNEISNFQQRFDESLHEAWDRYKDLLHACPHHGFTELHQIDTFYNALNPADQDSLNFAPHGNLLERRTQDVLTIIENKSKQTITVTTAMTAILKQFQATPPPAFVKFVKEICVTCGGAHPYCQCLTTGGNTFPELRDNIKGCVAAVAVNYNQGNFVYRPSEQSYQAPTQQNKVVPLNEANMKAMQTQINNVKNKLRNEMKNSIQASMSNQTNKLRNMMANFFIMNTNSTLGSRSLPSKTIANLKGKLKSITTRSGIVLDGPSVPILPPFINPDEDERVEETLTDQDLAEYTIKKMPKALLSNKKKLLEMANTPLNENCSAVILKKLPKKLGDPRKFLIPCGFNELKCKAQADLGASINLMPLFVWKKLGLTNLISTRMTLELANQAICTPAGITRDAFEFADELALITFSPGNDELQFDIEFDLKEIEYLLHYDPIKDMDYILKDSIDQSNLVDLNDNLVDSMLEMFPDEHTLDYSSPPLYDEYDDDLFEVESDTEYVYDDPFDSKGEKIKEA